MEDHWPNSIRKINPNNCEKGSPKVGGIGSENDSERICKNTRNSSATEMLGLRYKGKHSNIIQICVDVYTKHKIIADLLFNCQLVII